VFSASRGEPTHVGDGQAKIFVRIDRGIVDPDLVVEVRPRRAAAESNVSQDVATLHVLSGSHCKVPEMPVTSGNPATVINDYGTTVPAHKVSE